MAKYYKWNGIIVKNAQGKKVCVVLAMIIDPAGDPKDSKNYMNYCISVRYKSRNLYRKYNAWGYDDEVIETLKGMKVRLLFVVEQEDKKVYVISMEGAENYGIREAGQLFIPLSVFKPADKEKPHEWFRRKS